MDGTAAAILALTKEIGDLKGVVGELAGRTTGLGREIGDLKTLIGSNNSNCSRCKEEIYTQIGNVDAKVEYLREHGASISQQNAADIKEIKKKIPVYDAHCTSEQAVETAWDRFWNNSITRWGMLTGIILVGIGWFLQWRGII